MAPKKKIARRSKGDVVEEGKNESDTPTPTPSPSPKHSPAATEARNDNNNNDDTQDATTSISLTWCKSASASDNVGTVKLSDLIGSQDLAEMWQINFMINIPFVWSHLDPKVRDGKKDFHAWFIHGLRAESVEENLMQLGCQDLPDKDISKIDIVKPCVPYQWGTHHSKMMVLIFDSGELQIVIHTANMIQFDWTDMTQAVWVSPRLAQKKNVEQESIGQQFKRDFILYLKSYNQEHNLSAAKKKKERENMNVMGINTHMVYKELVEIVEKYDFSPVKAVFIASTPIVSQDTKDWALEKLGLELSKHAKAPESKVDDEIIVQSSSIGTLGKDSSWLDKVFLNQLSQLSNQSSQQQDDQSTKLQLVWPTVEDVRNSFSGYASGTSIHLKIDGFPNFLQIRYLQPLMNKWQSKNAGRQRCAPHIKTFCRIRKSNNGNDDEYRILWYLMTSANLSKPAWGSGKNAKQNNTIRSYECGVLVTPEMFGLNNGYFIPLFGNNNNNKHNEIGIRLPYDLPLTPYRKGDKPWTPHRSYDKPDSTGHIYEP